MPLRIVSGGQTGVDRAALDVAWEAGLEQGGWCPKGRIAEDGVLDSGYRLDETPSSDYAQRTAWNVRDSDATLIITTGLPTGGTAYTIEVAESLDKPLLVVNPAENGARDRVADWIRVNAITTLNVAGPRESSTPGIYEQARSLLRGVAETLSPGDRDS